jgi:hypothetical protein
MGLAKYMGPIYEGDISFTMCRTGNSTSSGCKYMQYRACAGDNLALLATPASPTKAMGRRLARYGQIPVASTTFSHSISINDTGMSILVFNL